MRDASLSHSIKCEMLHQISFCTLKRSDIFFFILDWDNVKKNWTFQKSPLPLLLLLLLFSLKTIPCVMVQGNYLREIAVQERHVQTGVCVFPLGSQRWAPPPQCSHCSASGQAGRCPQTCVELHSWYAPFDRSSARIGVGVDFCEERVCMPQCLSCLPCLSQQTTASCCRPCTTTTAQQHVGRGPLGKERLES